jgi:4-hydroxy-2-oxoheptanedioate aldolase
MEKEGLNIAKLAMRKSRTLAKLRAGEPVYSVKLNTVDPRVAEIAAMSGFPCIWIDTEHTANDYAVIERQIMAAKIHGTDVLIRIPRGSYSDYIRPLELDASGIMVPQIMSVKDAQDVVRITKFHPQGRRPIDGGNADGLYAGLSASEYIEQANSERFVVLQIEDPEAMGALDGIANVEGYDMLFFGPGDYSHSLGVTGQTSHPLVQEGYKKVAEAAVRHGKFAGTVGSPESVPRLLSMGYRFLNIGADVLGLSTYFSNLSKAVEQ